MTFHSQHMHDVPLHLQAFTQSGSRQISIPLFITVFPVTVVNDVLESLSFVAVVETDGDELGMSMSSAAGDVLCELTLSAVVAAEVGLDAASSWAPVGADDGYGNDALEADDEACEGSDVWPKGVETLWEGEDTIVESVGSWRDWDSLPGDLPSDNSLLFVSLLPAIINRMVLKET